MGWALLIATVVGLLLLGLALWQHVAAQLLRVLG